MLYGLVRPYAAVGLKVYYRKINISHVERIPWDKPVIIAANHPTAFIEPCVLACFLEKPLYFLVAGYYFSNAFYTALLNDLHMLPVYRANENGFSSVKQNYETFEACYAAMKERKPIMILAEGHTNKARRLQPLKKATARVAFGAIANHPELRDLQVVPVGVNFTDANRFRSEIMIDVQPPIAISDFYEQYQSEPNAAIKAFNQELWNRLSRGVIHINEPQDEPLAEALLKLGVNDNYQLSPPVVTNFAQPLQKVKAFCESVNGLEDSQKTTLDQRVSTYQKALTDGKQSDRSIADPEPKPWWQVLVILIGAPIFLIGASLNIPPIWLAKKVADAKVHRSEFYAPVLWAVALVVNLVYFPLLILFFTLFLGWPGLLLALLVPILGILAVRYYDFFRAWFGNWKLNRLPEKIRLALRQKRTAITEFILP